MAAINARTQVEKKNQTTNPPLKTPLSLALSSSVQSVLHSPGQSLDTSTRLTLEPRYGHNFGNVRVHTDSRAAESAREVNALAYTVGRDIVFGAGQYVTQTRAGQKLIAHELTHVVQQSQSSGALQVSSAISKPTDATEMEAEKIATRVVAGLTSTAITPLAAGLIQRQAKGKSPAPHPVELEIGSVEITDVMDPTCKYEPGEKAKSHTAKGILDLDVQFANVYGINTADEDAILIADFGVGDPELKPSTRSEFRSHWLSTFKADATNPLELIGYSDCVGWEMDNIALRQQRAQAVARLFAGSGVHLSFVGAIEPDLFLTDNKAARGRALNRSVVIHHKQPTRKPKPKPVPPKHEVTIKMEEPDTKNCSPEQRRQLAIAFPAAKLMAEKARAAVFSPNKGPVINFLLQRYFGDDARAHLPEIHAGFDKILNNWKDWDARFDCEKQTEASCPRDVPHEVTIAYVTREGHVFSSPSPYGAVHVCEAAFNTPGNMQELSASVLHELSHRLDSTHDKKYCGTDRLGQCASLSTEAAIDNADSYAQFAREIFNASL